jgi:hypothetical protein
MPRLNPAAIGLRVHSGWAMLVAVSGSMEAPVVLDRRRIVIADRAIRGSVQPFHEAKELGLAKAQGFLDRCAESSLGVARTEVRKAIVELRGYEVTRCGILLGSGRRAGLEATLRSHAAIHTAEGEFFRDVLRRAVEDCGLEVKGVREKELFAVCGVGELEMLRRLKAMGKALGAPWTQDEKFAALAGWMALK